MMIPLSQGLGILLYDNYSYVFSYQFFFTVFFSTPCFAHCSVSLCTAFLTFHSGCFSLHVHKSVEQKQACTAEITHLLVSS